MIKPVAQGDNPNQNEQAHIARDAFRQQPWSKPVKDIVQTLVVEVATGLSRDEVQTRLEEYGPNRLRVIKRRSTWSVLVDQFKSLIVFILVAAAAVSFARQDWVEGGAIVVALLINTVVGFFTELQATRSIESLREMDEVEATVRRDGQKQRISAETLVPGDIVILDSGELISADIRLLKASKLQADESALTGESVPVDKRVQPVEAGAPLAERTSMLYKGTSITRGQGEGVVVATGMETEIGEISALVESAADEATPLEKRLNALGQKLVWITLGVAVLVGVVGFVAGRDLELMIETVIALAIAAVPEGLPIVATVALARGMWRMLRRNALMRRLSSVETLGATNIICTDKTGTLTKNEMTVTRLDLISNGLEVKYDYNPPQIFQNGRGAIGPKEDEVLNTALMVALLCNDAELGESTNEAKATGDPMELALARVAQQAGLSRAELLETMPEVERDAFDRETKQMATVHQTEQGYFVAVKGAPSEVLSGCTHLYGQNGSQPLDDSTRQRWEQRNAELARQGLRVLGLASKTMSSAQTEVYEDLQFVGLVGLMDPPREGVPEAIAECRQAGIRVIMVTGDQPDTARAIAKSVGLVDHEQVEVIHGSDFVDPEMASPEERARMLETSIYARVTPAQKLKLIDLHKENGAIVAMTGDGVNDAPALKSADIGIAMGQRGTQVAREAADMILQDDAFPTIVAAVEQGRAIFDNIRKFVIYLLSGNVGVILTVAVATVLAIPLPILPLQILYLNMINDVFPALALGIGRGHRAVMDRPPRRAAEPIITRFHWGEIIGYGVLIGLNLLATFLLAYYWLGLEEQAAVTVTFLTLSISRLLHAFNMRAANTSLLNNDITRNPWLWGALGVSLALLLLAVYWLPLAGVLELMGIGWNGWSLVLSASLVPLVLGQIYLMLIKPKLER